MNDTEIKECKKHGSTQHRIGKNQIRCKKCQVDAVQKRRRKVRETLVAEFGGKCRLCGYDHYIGGLDFHHVDDEAKDFALSGSGMTRAIEVLRREAAKCILVCCRCHREIHAGLIILP